MRRLHQHSHAHTIERMQERIPIRVAIVRRNRLVLAILTSELATFWHLSELHGNFRYADHSCFLIDLDRPLLPGHNPPPTNIIDDHFPFLAPLRSLFKFGRKTAIKIINDHSTEDNKRRRNNKRRKHKKDVYTGSCIPQELVFHFSAYIALLNKRKLIDSPIVTSLMNANAMLSDAMSGLERVLTSELWKLLKYLHEW